MRKLRKTMALLLALTMVLATFGAVTVSAASFSDTTGHWAENVIDKWSDAGVVNGYSDGTFKPDNNITRAELAKVISTARQYTTAADINFSDVDADAWYAEDLSKCVAEGVIGGYEDGTFKPENNVTREEAAAMLQRAYQVNAHGLISFADTASISPWAETAVTALVGAGVINGYEDGTFRPADSITRAEVVKILDGITTVGTEPGSTTAPGSSGQVSTGSVVSGGLGGSGGGGYAPGGIGGGSGTGNGITGYPVTFNANGGTFANGKETTTKTISRNSVIGGAEPDVTRVEKEEVVVKDEAGNVVKDENGKEVTETVTTTYLLSGWYTSKSAADSLDSSKKWDINSNRVTSGITLYAGWYLEGTAVVTFETNGGSDVAAQIVKTDGYATEPAAPTREHYTFLGWYESNTAAAKFNFAGTPIKSATTIYARWSIDPAYAAEEITLPTKTVGSYNNGTIIAAPVSALPGEKVTLKIVAPEGYYTRAVKEISYISSVTGNKKSTADDDDPLLCTFDEYNETVTFYLWDNVEPGSIEVDMYFTAGNNPMEAPATPEPEPEATPLSVAYVFSNPEFKAFGTSFPANTDVNGFSTDAACSMGSSNKTFNGTGVKYDTRLQMGKHSIKLNVLGPCKITIDAVSGAGSSSPEDRPYTLSNSAGTQLAEYLCIYNENNSFVYEYTGGKDVITMKDPKGINVYGIYIEYDPDFKPEADPTPDPNAPHKVIISDNANGTVTASAPEASQGQTVTIDAQPAAGYKVVSVATTPVLSMTNEGNSYSFTMPYEDVTVTARIVPDSAEERIVTVGDVENGTVTITPNENYATAPSIDSSEKFLMYNGQGGGWAVTAEGRLPGDPSGDVTAIETSEAVKDNETNMMALTGGGVQYVLDNAIGEGPFTLSYDMYMKSANKRSFRTYFDNAADQINESGKAVSSTTNNAFFHMTNVNDKVYVTGDVDDISFDGTTAMKSGVQVGKNELEPNRWYRVVISGDIGKGPVTAAFYKHGVSGTYAPTKISAEPSLITTEAPFVTGRDALLKQVKLIRTATGTMYYDNIKLVTYAENKYRAYDGETYTVVAEPGMGYELGEVIVTDASGNRIPLEQVADGTYTFTVPSSDVTATAVYVPETPDPAPADLKDITDDYVFIAEDYIKAKVDNPTYYDDNRVYLSGNHLYTSNKGVANEFAGGTHNNVFTLRYDAKTPRYVAIRPAFDAEITVYSESSPSRSVIAGVKNGSAGLYFGKYSTKVHTFTVPAGTCVFITAANNNLVGSDLYIGGFEVKHAGAAAAEIEAEVETDEVLVIDADAVEPDEIEVEAVETEEIDEAEDIDDEEEAVLPTPEEAADIE